VKKSREKPQVSAHAGGFAEAAAPL